MNFRRQIIIYVFLLICSVYTLSFSTARSNSNIGEGDKKIAILKSLLDRGSIALDYNLDDQMVQGRDGKYYTYHEFGQNFFVLPIFYLTRFLVEPGVPFFMINTIVTALSCVIIIRILILLRFNLAAAGLTSLLYGVATFAWFYGSKTPFEHSIAVFLILGEFYFTLRYSAKTGKPFVNLFMAGACIGIGFVTRTDVVLSILPLGVLMYPERKESREDALSFKKILSFFLPMVLCGVIYLFYNFVRFGDALETGYPLLSHLMNKRLFSLGTMPMGAVGLLVSPGKSIFLFQPVLFLLPFGFYDFYRKTPRHFFWACCTLVIIYVSFYSSFVDWHGDWCWGPRYLLVITPFLIMSLAAFFEKWEKKNIAVRALAVALIAISISLQVLPVLSNFYLSLCLKFDGYTIDTWTSWDSYFVIKDSAIVKQFEVLTDSISIFFNTDQIQRLAQRLWLSQETYTLKYIDLYGIDLWWIQELSLVNSLIVAILMSIAFFSSWRIIRILKADSTLPINSRQIKY